MFKFLHAADIHLDSPLVGLERYEGLPHQEIRAATRRALEKLVQLAIEERVNFVLIAGDVYDGTWRDYRTGLYFITQLTRLTDAGIEVFMIAGNHDAQNKMMSKALRLPNLVTMFDPKHRKPVPREQWGVSIYGQSFADEKVLDNIALTYPKPDDKALFNIAMLHTCGEDQSGHHKRYAPCCADDLRSRNYDYWALGHIHQRPNPLVDPHIVFPGNIQGRNIRETGAKGCFLVNVDDNKKVSLEFHSLDVLRWADVTVDLHGVTDRDSILDLIQAQMEFAIENNDDLPLIARVKLRGPTSVHQNLHSNWTKWINEIRALAIAAGHGRLAVEKVMLETSSPLSTSTIEHDGPLAEIPAVIRDWLARAEHLEHLKLEMGEFSRKTSVAFDEESEDRPDNVDWLRRQLQSIEPMLIGRILGEEAKP